MRDEGYLPEAVRNYIALLGWGYDESTTFMTTDELVERFALERVSKRLPAGYTIARMVISCCAADANPMQVHVAADAPFPPDTWVQAVVTAVPNTATVDNGYVPTVTITSIAPIPQPADPYEH